MRTGVFYFWGWVTIFFSHFFASLLSPLEGPQEEPETFKTKDTQISGTSSPGAWEGEDEQTYRHAVKAIVEEDRTGSRLTYAKQEGVERSEERGNGGRVIGGRGTMQRSGVGGKGGRMI